MHCKAAKLFLLDAKTMCVCRMRCPCFVCVVTQDLLYTVPEEVAFVCDATRVNQTSAALELQ